MPTLTETDSRFPTGWAGGAVDPTLGERGGICAEALVSPSPSHEGWVERFKRFRDSHRLKPLLTLVIYLIAPLATFQLVLLQYPLLDPTRLRTATAYIIPLGLLMTSVSLVQESFPKGTHFRLYLDGVYVLLTMLWLMSLLGGSPVITSHYDGYPFTIDVTPMFALAALTAVANFAHDVLEHRHYRALSGAEQPAPSAPAGEGLPSPGLALRPDGVSAASPYEVTPWAVASAPSRHHSPVEPSLSIIIDGRESAFFPPPAPGGPTVGAWASSSRELEPTDGGGPAGGA